MTNASPGRTLPFAFELLLAALTGGVVAFLFRAERPEGPNRTEPAMSSPSEGGAAKRDAAAAAEGAAPRPVDIDTTNRERPATPSAAASLTLLYGTVKNVQGRAGRGAVTLDSDTLDSELLGWANDQGEYAIACAPSGGAWLVAKIEGSLTERRRIEIPPQSERLRFDFVLQSAQCLPVQILTTEGSRLMGIASSSKLDLRLTQNVNIVVTAARPGSKFVGLGKYLIRDGLGEFRRREFNPILQKEHPDDIEGVLELLRAPPLFASLVVGSSVVQTLPVTADLDKLVFTVDVKELQKLKGSIRTSVVKASGEASATAIVTLSTPFSAHPGTRDEKGVLFSGIHPGSYTLRILDGERVQHIQAVELEPGQHLDLGPMTLGKTILVKGKTVNEKGKAIRTDLGSREWKGSELGPQFERAWLGSGDGTFELRLTPGRHLLDASAPGYSATALTLDTDSLTEAPVILTLRKGVPVILTLPSSRLGTVRYSIRDSEDQVLWTRPARIDEFRMRLRLPAGTYTLFAESDTGAKAQQSFQVSLQPLLVNVEVP